MSIRSTAPFSKHVMLILLEFRCAIDALTCKRHFIIAKLELFLTTFYAVGRHFYSNASYFINARYSYVLNMKYNQRM